MTTTGHHARGRTALVTGGSRGIGAEIVRTLSAAGMAVINLDREAPAVAVDGARHVQVDLSDAAALTDALARVTARDEIVCVINNAAVGGPLRLEQVTLEAFERLTHTNLRAALQCAQAALPAMKRAGWGRIVNITSRAALGKEGRSIYGATKAGLISLTRTWALELGQHGITVNAVGPGPINTELFARSNPPDSPATRAIVAGIPVKRIGEPRDVAHAVGFFASEQASFITGQVLYVCGGLTVGNSGI
ncbi:SDR family NAD(P)-dependent oxidoreductase [Cupriavidus sp. Marseille-Q8015]|nr:MAG: SDR family oxidoreductase [Cupriavidus sp.]